MRRKINFTNRRRLERSRLDIKLVPHGTEPPTFSAALNLGELGLPPEASVYVEALDRASYMRFPFGTVASIKAPGEARLTELQSQDAISFRVRVIDDSAKHGLILATGEAVALDGSTGEQAKLSLLPVRYTGTMGQRVWRVDFSEAGPVLEVNSAFSSFSVSDFVARNGVFASLVFPAVLGEILRHVVLVRGVTDPEGEDWENHWLRFVLQVGAARVPAGAEEEALSVWVEEAVDAFCSRIRARDRLETEMGVGVES